MQIPFAWVVILFVSLEVPASAQAPAQPVVAFAHGTTMTLATAAGEIVQEIKLKHPIYDFALSKDRTVLVTVAPDTAHGGDLNMTDLRTHAQTRLTRGHLVSKPKDLEKGEKEVYGDLQFSPDGHNLVFGVHWNIPSDGNDAWENSGPFAVMNLASHKIRILKSTNNIDGNGPCSENHPMWSPDGKWILFSCEDGAFIVNAQGKTLRDLKLEPDGNWGTGAVSWFGNSCVLYIRTPDTGERYNRDHDELRLLNLLTNEAQEPRSLPDFPKRSIPGLIEASDGAFIRLASNYNDLVIETDGKTWKFPYAQAPRVIDGASAHVLEGWKPKQIPSQCK